MEDVFDAAWREHPASSDTQVDATLASLIDIRGLGLLDDPTQLRQLLLQACPDAQRHIAAVLTALTAQVPAHLVAAKDDDTLPDLLRGSVRHLQDEAGLDADWAQWAVRAWAHAFALPTAGLDAPAAAPVAPSFASPIASARPPRADGFDHAGAGTIGGLWDRSPVQATDPQPAAPDVREPTLGDSERFAPTRSDPGLDATSPVAPLTPRPVAALPPEEVPPHAEPLFVEPLFPDPPVETVAHDEAVGPPVVAPTWVHHERPDEPRRRSPAGPIAMVVVVLAAAAIAWFALEGTPWSKAPTRTATAPIVEPPQSQRATTPAAPSTITPASTPASTPATTAPTPVTPPSGDATTPGRESTPSSSPAAAPEETSRPLESPPAPTATVEPEPAKPLATRRPAIARVDVPTVVEGAPFAVALQLATSARDVVTIERRVVDSGGNWPRLPTQFQASGLQRAGDRTLLVPFRAMDAPSSATVEFVAIGRDGVRSDAKRVAISLNAPDPAIAALESPAACTSATCGVVIESREIEPEIGTRGAIYQLSVRMDDRQIVTSTAPYRLQIGSRARMAGTRLVPVDRP